MEIPKLHFSQIFFDEEDVRSTNTYFLVYEIWETTKDGGWKFVPEEFKDNFIIGLFDFKMY